MMNDAASLSVKRTEQYCEDRARSKRTQRQERQNQTREATYSKCLNNGHCCGSGGFIPRQMKIDR